jgi:nucleotide-binding universal stress UspA family protein
MMPFLDLRHIAIDPLLVQRLPLGVAQFYEALPVAREGDSVTVAMSHPENVTALAVLTQLFQAEIVPIRTDGAAVRAALLELYSHDPELSHAKMTPGLLAWLPASTHPAWAQSLAEKGLTHAEMPMTWLDADKIEAETLLAAAQGGNYQLTLCAFPEAATQSALLREIHAPLWLVPEKPTLPQPLLPERILLVLRGFASDEIAVSWVLRLAKDVENPAVTLLPLIGNAPWGALNYLRQPASAQGHVTECALRLAEVGIQPTLTLHSGEPRQQVVQAMRQGNYDLMVVAAEGHGQFVGQLLADLEETCTLPLGGVLVLKPSHEHAQRLP